MRIVIEIETDDFASAKQGGLIERLLNAMAASRVKEADEEPPAPQIEKAAEPKAAKENKTPPVAAAAAAATAAVAPVAPVAATPPVSSGPTLDDMKALFTKVIADKRLGGPKAAMDVVRLMGYKCLANADGAVPPEKYGELSAKLKALIEAADRNDQDDEIPF